MDTARIGVFRRALEEAAAERRVPTTHGTALLSPSLRDVYDLNFLRVERPAPPDELAAEAEHALETCFHRKLESDEELAVEWPHTVHLAMAHHREPDRRVDTSAVREVGFDAIAPARTDLTLTEPWGEEAIARDLNDAKLRTVRAVPTRFFAAFDGDRPVAWCELRSADGVSQIEDVNTLPEARGRGFGRAIVQHALERAEGLVFLEALADDWPRELYARLGFDEVTQRHHYLLAPSPLTRLRLRTPRLELRLATVGELRELFAVAAAGIHPPDEMPFAVPWTDDLAEKPFLRFHAETLARWQPDSWSLQLVAFSDGRPIGSQGIEADDFARTHAVHTGSWLGRDHQGQGLGTEMRAAVLTLAFETIGARLARSGAIQGNAQSLGVSRKLGYRAVGERVITARAPVPHTDLELRREAFRTPVPVEVAGPLTLLRPLFGCT